VIASDVETAGRVKGTESVWLSNVAETVPEPVLVGVRVAAPMPPVLNVPAGIESAVTPETVNE